MGRVLHLGPSWHGPSFMWAELAGAELVLGELSCTHKYTLFFQKKNVCIGKKYLPASQNITHLICVNMLRSNTLA